MAWVSIKDRLPEVIENENGRVNCVLVYKKDGFDGGSDIQVWNTVSFYKHYLECTFTHWMPLPKPPKEKKNGG